MVFLPGTGVQRLVGEDPGLIADFVALTHATRGRRCG